VGEADVVRDGISDEQARLGLVRDALLSYDHIRAIVIKNEDQIVRLIPVSAVGSAFGELDESGHVMKRPGAQIHPTNVEIPLCAVLPDLFAQVERSLDQSVKDALRDARRARKRRRALEAFAGTLATVVAGGLVLGTPVPVAVGDSAAGLLFGAVDTSDDGVDVNKRLPEGVASAQRVGASIMTDFKRTVSRLELTLPGSTLSA
jgi:uncharacterized membrane protein